MFKNNAEKQERKMVLDKTLSIKNLFFFNLNAKQEHLSEGCRKHSRSLIEWHSSIIKIQVYRLMLNMLGPVVQSVVSLTSSFRVISLTVLADSIYNFLKFFAEKM